MKSPIFFSKGRSVRFWIQILLVLALVRIAIVPSALYANPTGEQVVGGAAGFNRPDAATLIVNQGTDRAVINWNSFSIAYGELTKFVQPSSSSAVLNRVVTANPSAIYGTLQANGNVYLINPGGVLVGAGGVINTASFVASTHDISTEEFMKGGQLNFKGNSDASVINEGNITAREGDVFLIAKEVKNEGQLMAKDGTVGMVSGTEVSLQAVGQGNYKVRLMAAEKPMTENGGQKTAGSAEIVNDGVIQAANAVLEAKGSYLPMAIKNTGVIEATGLVENGDGSVTLTGGEGDILNTGVVAALQRSLDGQKEMGGSIMMTAKNVTSDLGSVITAAGKDGGGVVKLRSADTTILRGSIEVVGASESAKGGKVQLLGERVGLFESAKVDASGGAGGGEVLVGGDYLGKNPNVPNAKAVVMGSEAKIMADTTANGNGGRVILWSDEYTGFYGDISARGGALGGDGGFVETSSKNNLQAFGNVDASAPNGNGGFWLLDPTDVTITAATNFNPAVYVNPWVPTGASSQISAASIASDLNAGTSVTIQTSGANGQTGNITMTAGISKDATVAGTASSLTMIAAGSINISQPITSVDGALSLVLGAGSGIAISATVTTLGGDITMQGANAAGSATDTRTTTVTLNSGANISTLGGTGTGNLTINASGAITQNAGSTLNIKGTTSVITGGALINLTQASNDFNGAVSLTNTGSNAVAITDADSIILGNLSVGSGAIAVTAVGITQTGTITQAGAGAVTFNGGAGVITLTQANNFEGAVSLSNTGPNAVAITDATALTLGTLAVGGNLTVTSTGALNLGQGTVGGALTATSNNNPITQTPSLSVSGLTTINAGTSSINLPGPSNAFTGGVLLTAGTITAFQNSTTTTLTPAGDITIGNITIPGGTLTVTAGGSITINGNIDVGTGSVILSAGNSQTSTPNGQIQLSGTPTITAANFSASGYSVGLPQLNGEILVIGTGGASSNSLTFSALSSGGPTSALQANRDSSSYGVFLRKLNTGDLTVGTLGLITGVTSTGAGGVIVVNVGDITVSSNLTSNGGPIYLSSSAGGIAINSTVQSAVSTATLTASATVGLYAGANYTGQTSAIIDSNTDGLISAERLGLATPGFAVTLDSGLHQPTQIAADTGILAAAEADFTFSGASYYLGEAGYFNPAGSFPAVPSNLSGVKARAISLTSSGDITPPVTVTSTRVISVGVPAGAIGIDVLTTAGGSIRLDSPNNESGAASVRLRSLSGGLLGGGDISYLESNGYDLAGLRTSGEATLQFGGNITQSTAAMQVGTLTLSGTGNVNFGTQNNQIGILQGDVAGSITLLDTTTTLFSGLVIGTSLTQGLSSSGTVTITTTGDLTQVGPLSANNLVATANSGSITLELASGGGGGASLNQISQLSMTATGAGNDAIYRDIDSYTVNRAVAPDVVSLGADGGLVQDNATFLAGVFTAATTVMSGTGLEFVGRNGANFDLQNVDGYAFERFAATGNLGASNFFYRDTDWIILSTVRTTAGVVSGVNGGRGNFMITAGGDITQDAPVLVNNFRAMVRDTFGGGRVIVLANAGNDVESVSLQMMDNAGGNNPNPTVTIPGNPGLANNPVAGRIYFRDTDGYVVGINQAIGEVVTTVVTTGVVTLQAPLGGRGVLVNDDSNVVLESGVLDIVTQRSNALDANQFGTAIYTTGLGLIGGDFTLDLGSAMPTGTTVFDTRNNVSFFATQTLDNDISFREFNGYTVNFVRMNFPLLFQGGLSQADFQVNGIQAGNVILQVQAPTDFLQGFQGIFLDFTGTLFGGNGQTLLSGFSTTDMTFNSPGYIESSGRVIINIGNSDATIPGTAGVAGTTDIGRFTMDQGIHVITTVAGGAPPAHDIRIQGNRDIAIFADNMVLGGDGNPAIVVTGLIQTPDIKTAPNPMETVTLAPFTDDRQLFVSSPKATLGNTSTTGTQVNPNQLELSTGELRRVNTDRLIIRSNYTDLLTETPAVNVRSPINVYGLYDDTFAALGVFPNNAGLNRLQLQAAGGTGSYAWAEAEISSDVNQLPLQVFVVSANNPYTTPDVLPPVATLPTQGDRVVVSGGIRSYGGTVILRGQDATITGGINATTQGLVGIMPAVAGRAITLGTEPGGTLSILRSELGLVTAGTVQIGGLDFASMPVGIENNPFYVNEFESVNAGLITITDLMSGLSADTLALVTDAGVDEQAQGGVVAPGLALIGGTTAGSNFLLDSDNNDVDRLAVYMADAGVVITGDDPVQNVVYHDQNGFGGGNGFEVALVQQQAEQGLLRSAATTGTIPVGTGLGLIRANQLSITAGGDVTVYDVIPAGGPTSTSYIGHVPTIPGVPVFVLGNLVNLLAIDASTPSPETGGVNEVFFSAANGLGVGDIGPNGTNLRGGVAGILTNGGNITLEGNDIQIYTVNRATGDDINIDTTADGIAPDGARVVLRPSTGFNGFVDRAGAGAPVEILLGGPTPPVVPPVENVATLALDGILDLAKAEIGQNGVRASVLEIGSRSNPATYAGKISVADNFNTFSPLLEVLHLLTGGAIEDIRATTGTLLTGLTVNNLAAEANGSISLIGALNSIGTFAAESNFGQSEVRLFNNRATVLGTVDGISGILSSTFAAQLTAGGITQTPGSSIEAGLLSINTSAGNGDVTLNSENGVAQVAINAGTGNILLRTTGNTRIVSATASQPGGVPVAVSGLTGSFITLYSGGDVSQDANAPITKGGPATPTAVTVVTQNGFSITLDATSNRLPANSVFAAVTSSGALGNLTNLTLVNGTGGGGLELGSGAVIDINLTSAGSGYTGSPVPLTATISAPAGVGGTTATGQVVAGVKTVGVTSAGAGYLSAPTVTIGGTGGAAAVAIVDSNPLSSTYGQVTSIQITDPGTGYLTLPTVTLSGGSPTQAAVVAATELQITGLVITNPGSRYNATPTVTISGTGGSGATGATSVGGTGGVYFASGSAVSGGITGNLNIRNLSAVAGISQQTTGTAGAIAVAGTTTLADSSAAGINLGNNNNNLQGTITVTQSGGGNVAIGNNNSSVLGNFTLSGGLGAQTLTVSSTGGSIYQFNNANVITAPGAASFFATANGLATGTPVGSVILNNALNDFGGAVSAAGTRVVIRDSTALDLGTVAASTSLVASSTSAGITQSGVITSTGAASFAAAAGQSIILGDSSNVFGSTVSFSALSGQLQNVTVTDSTALNLQALNILGDLVATGAGLTQSGILQAANADLRSTGSGNSLNLSTFNNIFSGQVRIRSDGNASLFDNGPLIIGNGGASIVAGNLTLSSAGAFSQTQSITVNGTGTSSITTTAGVVTLGNLTLTAGNLAVSSAGNFTQAAGTSLTVNGTGTSSISTTAGNITFGNAGAAASSNFAGNLSVVSLGGTIEQAVNGSITVTGTSSFNSNNGAGTITLDGSGNNFVGAVTLTGGVTEITDGVGGLTLGTVNTGDLTAITTAAGGALNLGQGTVTGFLTATTSNGNITQNGILTVTGATTLTAGTGNIVLGSANSLANVTVNSATDVTLRNTALTAGTLLYPTLPAALQNLTLIFDNSAATLSANPSNLTGSLSITAGGGAISSVNPISVSGATILSAGSSAITFSNAANDFVGTVTIRGTGVVTMKDANNLTLVGQQSLNLGNITTVGAFTVSSPANITSTSGTEINAGGTITLTAGNNANVKVDQNDNALIGSVNVAETFTLRTDAAIGFTLGGAGGFGLSAGQLNNFRVGTFAPVADGANITIPTAFNYGGIQNLSLTTLNSGNIIANGAVSVGTLSLSSAGTASFNAVNQIQNLGNVAVANGGLTFLNGRGLNLTGTASMPGRLSLEVAGQFYNQTGQSQPLGRVASGSVIKSLSLMGGLPNQVSGLAGFSYRYDGQMPTSGNVMSYAVSPLAMFAPGGTTIAGVDLGGTQTGGGQFNTFLTGSDNLNWMISDFGRFDMPTVKPSGMDYILYPQRVEPETKTLPAATLGQLERELGRPPTLEEIQAREVAVREAAMVRSGAILERTSFDAMEDEVDKQESAEVPAQVIDGGKPQADARGQRSEDGMQKAEVGSRPSFAPSPASAGGASQGFGSQARKTQSVRQGSNGPILRSGPIRSVAQLRPAEPSQSGNISEASAQALKLDAKSVIEQERASAEVGIAPPIASGR